MSVLIESSNDLSFLFIYFFRLRTGDGDSAYAATLND